MIRHILFWNYTKEVKENHLEKETLQKLKESVQTLEGIEGLLCVEMEENLTSGYDLVFYSEFENLEALRIFKIIHYMKHIKSVVGILFVSVYVEILKDENRTY